MNKQNTHPGFLKAFLGKNLVLLPGDRAEAASSEATKTETVSQSPPPADPAPSLSRYGKFTKKILLLTAHEDEVFPKASEKMFLDKFLPAIQYTWADVKLVNVHPILQEPDLFQNFLDTEGYVLLIAFLPKDKRAVATLDLTAYQPGKKGGRWHLLADPIEILEADEQKVLKRKLWEGMQAIMNEIA